VYLEECDAMIWIVGLRGILWSGSVIFPKLRGVRIKQVLFVYLEECDAMISRFGVDRAVVWINKVYSAFDA